MNKLSPTFARVESGLFDSTCKLVTIIFEVSMYKLSLLALL